MTRRAVSGLDPFPSVAEIAAKFKQRTGRELVLDQGPARHAETRLVAPVLVGRRAECEAIGERLANGIRLVLPVAPRTENLKRMPD